MKLRIAKENEEPEVIKSFSLEESRDGKKLIVTDGTWEIITFTVVGDKVVFCRNGSVSTEAGFKLDALRRIVEVAE
jgi:hypothetical protein